MDRKSKQKIILALVLLGFFWVIGMFIYCGWEQEKALRMAQREELQTIYPEIREELEWNFEYYQKKSFNNHVLLLLSVAGAVFFFGIIIFFITRRKERKKQALMQERVEWIYEQLHRFHQGDFQMQESSTQMEEQECWYPVYEKMRELGYYFDDMKERLMEEENSTKMLITDISHQLKTPLASIRMCHELSGSDSLTRQEREEFLQAETREIEKLEMLLDELVKLSRLENNMIQVKPEKCSLKETIREAVGQMFMKAYEKQMEISVELEQDVEVSHDRKWTVEAFVNILENAVKYSPEGTNIHIRVQILVKSVLIEIEDEGIGIAEDELYKIFRRFYRGEQAKKRIKDGAGVGLYLARSIIEQQGGTILAKRKPEKGSIFNVILPLD